MSKVQVQQEYERLDEIRCKITALAESKCRKLRMGQVAFSPELNHIRLKIKVWLLLSQHKQGQKISSRLLARTLKKAGISSEVRSFPSSYSSEQLKLAYSEYYSLKGQAKSLRDNALETLAEAIAMEGNTTQEKALTALRAREKQRSSARKLRYIRGKVRSGSTTMVTTVNEAGKRVDITDKCEMERAILRSNMNKFSQSFHTPFYQSPLKEEFGFKGLTSASQAVLAGIYESRHQMDKVILEVISEWRKPDAVRELGPIDMELTIDQYRAFWNKANENISCYPSALSFATMKAGSFDPDISLLECALTKIPLAVGFAPQRWKRCLDVMILKKSGVMDLSSLRTIILFPVDCNYAFKHVGREMMKVAEKTNSLAPEQFGSRKRHRAIDLAVNKTLTFDILRQLKRPGAICSNDAKSCYDLIGHTQAAISMQRVGVPKNAINCLFTTLQEAVHTVRTGYGDSDESYGGQLWLVPIHGIGQGNGAGPAIWAVVSTPLLNVLRSKGYGCEICTPLSSRFHKFVGYAFVDDTDIIQSSLTNSAQEAMLNLQQAIDTWESSLKTTCGAIVPEKTIWWLVSFHWAGGRWKYDSILATPGDLYVNDIHNERKLIRRLEPEEAYETLGVFMAPDGNSRAQIMKMKRLAGEWADAMRTGKIRRDEVWLALQSTIWRSLSYPLPALRLSRSQYDNIMAPILHYALPAMGVCRNFARKQVFAPHSHLGLGIKHLHTMQEIAHVKDILTHTHSRSLMGTLYRAAMELFFIELGRGTSIVDIPRQEIEWLATDSLIKDTILFLQQHSIQLHHDIEIGMPRVHDDYIMVALSHLDLSSTDLKACNHCRLYLRALFVSDIATGDGTMLTEDAWLGRRSGDYRATSWPAYPNPSTFSWAIWRRCLQLTLTRRGRRLVKPLGDWLCLDEEWPWFYKEDSLYSVRHSQWYRHPPIIRRNRLPTFQSLGVPCSQPTGCQRATVYARRNQLVCSGAATVRLSEIPRPPTFLGFLAQSQDSVRWCFKSIGGVEQVHEIVRAIREGEAIAVCDGSFKDGFGTAAWIIESAQSVGHITGCLCVPGYEEDQSSYRSELAGIYAIMALAQKICDYFQITEGLIELGCDGQAALNMAFNSAHDIDIDASNHDIIAAIQSLWKRSVLTWKFRHVKGHQDDDPDAPLDRWAELNILMDSKAKGYRSYAITQPRHHLIDAAPWGVHIRGRKVITDISTAIYNLVHAEESVSYWKDKSGDQGESVHLVDWTAMEGAMDKVSRSRRVFIAKHASGMCGVGKFRKRWKQWDHDMCPRCGHSEDAPHVWTCRGADSDSIWTSALQRLEGWLHSQDTAPDIIASIINYLAGWRTGEAISYTPPFELRQLLENQHRIGWQRFFEGWISTDWALMQQRYYDILKSRRTGRRWVIALIQKLWDIAWDLWEHRNAVLHEKENVVSQHELRRLDLRITRVYQDLGGYLLLAKDVHLLQVPLRQLLRKDIVYKQTWLENATPALANVRHRRWSRCDAAGRATMQMRTTLRRWLGSA